MSTFYHSTRENNYFVTSKQAIVTGIAPDGGLFICPEVLKPSCSLEELVAGDFKAIAARVLGMLLPDFLAEELSASVEAAYGSQWDSAAITPVSDLGPWKLLELYHGPTCAFKDVALQMLPQLMTRAKEEKDGATMIVTATSGDTGKAALEGFADVDGIGVCVFYPHGKVSDIQHLQMVTQKGSNVSVCGIRGTFDDAQSAVKELFANKDVQSRLGEQNIKLSSANSINIGRLAPQVTYYIYAYAQLVASGELMMGDEVTFVVPTGNFGDVLAGYFAKCLGLPVKHLVVASNANNVLTDFLATGTYNRERPFIKTMSPSMDILISSNLERLLYLASNGNAELVASLMRSLRSEGSYTVPAELLATIQETFVGGCADDAATKETILRTFQTTGRVIDPHTAVAVSVAEKIFGAECDTAPAHLHTDGGTAPAHPHTDGGAPVVILSTASPYKFSADVLAALEVDTTGMNGFACMDALEQLSHTEAPEQLSRLRDAERLHEDVCDIDKTAAFVESACARVFM